LSEDESNILKAFHAMALLSSFGANTKALIHQSYFLTLIWNCWELNAHFVFSSAS